MFKIRLLSSFRERYIADHYLFSQNISLDEADALLCEWAPHDDILIFQGPKTWYNSEAVSRKFFDEAKWNKIKSVHNGHHFLYHSHPNTFYRVPMVAFVEPLLKLDTDNRIDRIVAIISNCVSTGPMAVENSIYLRNAFATHPLIDLYGREDRWRAYMQKHFTAQALPVNYKGEINGTWNSRVKFELMAKYKAAICLENVIEPYYFTEKFFAAVQAGCIPIYQAHRTLKEGVLKGAMWVDPVDFGFDIEQTLRFALAQDRGHYASNNFKWLENSAVRAYGLHQVFLRIGSILENLHGNSEDTL